MFVLTASLEQQGLSSACSGHAQVSSQPAHFEEQMHKVQQKPAQELFWALSACLVLGFWFPFQVKSAFLVWVEMQEKSQKAKELGASSENRTKSRIVH